MLRNPHLLTAIAACSAFAIGWANASADAAVVYEGFDYTTGLLDGNGGDNWNGAWQPDDDANDPNSAEFYVSTPGLSFTGLTTVGGKAGRTAGGTGGTQNRGWAVRTIDSTSQSALTSGSEMWFSFLYDSSGGEDFAFLFGDFDDLLGGSNPTLTSAGDAFGFAANGSNASTITFDNSTSQALGGTSNIGTETVFIVGKITWDDAGSGGLDKLELFNVPDMNTGEGDLVAFSTATADLTQSGFDTVGLWDRPNNIGLIDEIRLASSYADATTIPEPASLALLGIGGLLVAGRRRKV